MLTFFLKEPTSVLKKENICSLVRVVPHFYLTSFFEKREKKTLGHFTFSKTNLSRARKEREREREKEKEREKEGERCLRRRERESDARVREIYGI
jgi:hypothetical protein